MKDHIGSLREVDCCVEMGQRVMGGGEGRVKGRRKRSIFMERGGGRVGNPETPELNNLNVAKEERD